VVGSIDDTRRAEKIAQAFCVFHGGILLYLTISYLHGVFSFNLKTGIAKAVFSSSDKTNKELKLLFT
jgi:hypothetical protein